MMTANTSSWLMAILAPLLWGTTYSVTQAWLPGADPVWLATLRIAVPGLLMLPLVPFSIWRSHGGRILLLSTLNIGLFTVLLFAGIQRLPGGMAATLTASMPLQLLAFRALLGQAPTLMQLLCALGGMAGVGMLVWQAPAEPDWLGVAFSLLAATSMSLGVLLVPRLAGDVRPLVLTSAQLAAAGVALLLLMALTGRPMPELDTGGVLALFWMGPVTMGLGYLIWFRSVTRLPLDKLAFLGLINPVVAVFAGVLFMHEQITLLQLVAIALVLACVLLAQHPAASRVRLQAKSA
ncbi:DMT family transporter [Thalassolituus sp. LLYu03]|uniref:DMT family transporter n=1 Tax=Thalassolituus sp. LLYu03 TaxID=3421656 RepID=UPI003D29B540